MQKRITNSGPTATVVKQSTPNTTTVKLIDNLTKKCNVLAKTVEMGLPHKDHVNLEKVSKILAPVKEAKEMDLIDNFNIEHNESGVPVIRTNTDLASKILITLLLKSHCYHFLKCLPRIFFLK